MPRVLVVEDDRSVQQMLTIVLESEGLEVELAADGRTAIARLDDLPADLVLLDLGVPMSDGFEVLRELRARRSWEATPVVIVSGNDDDDNQWRGWSTGADWFLAKPFEIDELRDIGLRLLSMRVQAPLA